MTPPPSGAELGRRLATERPAPGTVLLTFLGQAGFALRGADVLVLVDPWLSTALEEAEGVTRPAAPALRPADVQGADLVCITHEHADHLDPVTCGAIARQAPGAAFLVPAPAVDLVAEAGVPRDRIHPALAGVALEAAGVRVTALESAHELAPDVFGGYRFWRDAQGDHRVLGYVLEIGEHRIYHAGDTIWWPGLDSALRELAPDVALLPINGRDAMREAAGLWGNLSADEAAALVAAAEIPTVVPCHWDGVAGNLGDPDVFVLALAERAPDARAHVLHAGEELSLTA